MDLNKSCLTALREQYGWLPRGAMDLNLLSTLPDNIRDHVGSLVEPWI